MSELNKATPTQWDRATSYTRSPITAPTRAATSIYEEINSMTRVESNGGSTSYYELPDTATELQDLIEYKNMNFAVANIFKAAYRLGQKKGNSDRYELNKIIFFAQRELDRSRE